MTTTYFTSDTHFGHKNIIRYDNRPFSSIEEHDEQLIENWNRTVNPNDIIYHLGDFGFGNRDYLQSVIDRLNGYICLIYGNHDKPVKQLLNLFSWHGQYKEIYIEPKELVILFHYPIESWNKRHYKSIHLHGHCHHTLKNILPRRIDVGTNGWDYTPVSSKQITDFINNSLTKEKEIDGHDGRTR